MKRAPLRLAIVALALVAASCGPIEERDPLLGQWGGSWTSGQGTGTLQVSFSGRRDFGDIALYNVEVIVTGTSCASGGDRGAGSQTAALREEALSLAVQFRGGPPGTEEGVFHFGGLVLGDQVTGSYKLLSDTCPQCTCVLDVSGTWEARR